MICKIGKSYLLKIQFFIYRCGENKNKLMFSFLIDLVGRGIFSKVKAGFLMLGHTHKDMDQLFSTIAHYFKAYKTCCADPESLAEEIRNVFTDANPQTNCDFASS